MPSLFSIVHYYAIQPIIQVLRVHEVKAAREGEREPGDPWVRGVSPVLRVLRVTRDPGGRLDCSA